MLRQAQHEDRVLGVRIFPRYEDLTLSLSKGEVRALVSEILHHTRSLTRSLIRPVGRQAMIRITTPKAKTSL